MPYFKIRTKLRSLLGKEMATNGQYALEHVLDALGKFDGSIMTGEYLPGDRSKMIINSDIAELLALWSFGYDLKAQDMRVYAMICKLLKITI